MSVPESREEIFGEPVCIYTRAQAIADGVLVDVSETAREAGFKFPVAITSAAWADCVAWTEEDRQRKAGSHQDEKGRLWDVISMLRFAIALGGQGSEVRFKLHRVPADGPGTQPELVILKSLCGPGDGGEGVITIMLPNED